MVLLFEVVVVVRLSLVVAVAVAVAVAVNGCVVVVVVVVIRPILLLLLQMAQDVQQTPRVATNPALCVTVVVMHRYILDSRCRSYGTTTV